MWKAEKISGERNRIQTQKIFRRGCALAFSLVALFGTSPVRAVDGNWITDGNSTWNNAANWSSNPSVPGGIDSVVGLNLDIGSSRTITIDTTSATVGTLNIGDAVGVQRYTVGTSGGAGLIFDVSSGSAALNKLSGGGNADNQTDLIDAPMQLNDSLVITNNTNNALRLAGVISTGVGSTDITVTGTGSGMVYFGPTSGSRTNTFVGNVIIDGANSRLSVNADSRLGNLGNDIVLRNGGSLFYESSSVINGQRNIILDSGGRIMLDQFSPTNRHTTVAGDISGNGGLTIAILGNSGTTIAHLAGRNDFSGGINLQNGLLRFASKESLGSSKSISFAQFNVGLSVLGTEVTDLSDFSFSFASGGQLTFDIQDPDNTFTWDKNFTSNLDSNGNTVLAKTGRGAMEIVVAQSYLGSSVTYSTGLNGGALVVNYEAGGSLASGGNITFGGGTLRLQGSSSGSSTQTLGSFRAGAGGGTLIAESNNIGGMTVNLGSFATPLSGGTLNIQTVNNTGTATVTTTQLNDTSGIIGAGRVIYNGSDFATNTTNTSGGEIGGYAGATSGVGDATVGSTVNYSQTGSATLGAATYANTLKLASSGAGESLNLGANAYRLTTGGLLYTGADDYSITNGTLASATATNSDLIIHQYGSGALTIGAVIANGNGNSTLTKAGSGTLILTNTNTYTGQTYVNGGVLSISAADQISAATLNLNGGTLRATSTLARSQGVSLGGSGGTFDVADGQTLTLTGAISGTTGALTLNNSGTGTGVLLLGVGNSFAGGVTIESGTLRLGNDGALNGGGVNTLKFGSGSTATLQLNGARNISVAGLTSSNANAVVENGATGAATLNVNNGSNNTFEGTLRNGSAGTLGLTKGGAGTLTLTGTNTYTGATNVYNGTLLVNGSLGNTAVTVTSGARLGGFGSFGGLVTIQSGGVLSPGNSPAVVTNEAGLSLNTGAEFTFELFSQTALLADRGAEYDGVDVTGGVLSIQTGVISNLVFDASGSVVDFTTAFWDVDQSWLVFENANTPTLASLGIFDTVNVSLDSQGNNFSVTGGTFYWNQVGNDVYLNYTAVPEPSTYAMIGVGLCALWVLRRRNKVTGKC